MAVDGLLTVDGLDCLRGEDAQSLETELFVEEHQDVIHDYGCFRLDVRECEDYFPLEV